MRLWRRRETTPAMTIDTDPASTELDADREGDDTQPRFRVDDSGQVVPANEAARAWRREANARERLEGPPWTWLVAGPVAKPKFDAWRGWDR